MLVTG